jgi:predicted phage terminase large subunit-like protein
MALIIKPQPGPQEKGLKTKADISIMGGAAGVGKTFALILETLRHIDNPQFGAVIFMRTSNLITNQGSLWDKTLQIYPQFKAKPRESRQYLDWTFPSGARIKFSGMELEQSALDWKGAEIPLTGWDQLEAFTEFQFWYLLSRSRSMCGVKPYVRATCNPDPDSFLATLLSWWIGDDGYAIPERSGVIRWFVRLNDEIYWDDSRDAVIAQMVELGCDSREVLPKSLTFIPGSIYDNKILLEKDPGYLANLKALPYVEQERLLGGNWKVRPAAGKIFNRADVEIIDAAPAEGPTVRAWDKASTPQTNKSGGENKKDRTAGVKMRRHGDYFFILDCVADRWNAVDRDKVIKQTARIDGKSCDVFTEQEGGSGGKKDAEDTIRQLAGWSVSAETSSGPKLLRWRAFASQWKAGNVKIVKGRWNEMLLSELHSADGKDGRIDDIVDACACAFNYLTDMDDLLLTSVFPGEGEDPDQFYKNDEDEDEDSKDDGEGLDDGDGNALF